MITLPDGWNKMRRPTTNAEALRWHNQALNDLALHLPVTLDDTFTPQCGWFLTKMSRGGPLVPARIWLEQEVDPDSGELLSDEILKCEINGYARDPEEQFIYFFDSPIEKSAYDYLMARKDFAEEHAPHEPAANPFKRLDWSQVPTPTFTKEIQP